METTQRESHKHPVNPERRYIRLQEIGLSHFFAWPVAIMVAAMFGFDFWVPHISVLLITLSVVFFSAGHVGRQKLKEQRERETNSDDRRHH
jgi:hypothetical protein